jgi:WD40 repeat protein
MQSSDYSDVFISYRRKDVDFAKKLTASLRSAGKEVWVDWEDIPPGSESFTEDIQRGLEGADAFIAVLSPDYLQSTYCVDVELGNALKLNKKIIPLVLHKFDDARIPQNISHINWIYFTPHAGQENTYDNAFRRVLDALDVDFQHTRDHTRYLLRASEWDTSDRANSFLLVGDEIEAAESWFASAVSKKPVPTELHGEYIKASRKHAARQRQYLLSGVTVALIISILLTIASLMGFRRASSAEAVAERNAAVAERQAHVNRSLALSSAALQPGNERFAVSLALEAADIENPGSSVLHTLMQVAYRPGVNNAVNILNEGETLGIYGIGISHNGRWVIVRDKMIDLSTGETHLSFEDAPEVSVLAAFMPDDQQVVIAGDIGIESQQEDNNALHQSEVQLGIFDTETGELVHDFQTDSAVSELHLSSDGKKLIAYLVEKETYHLYDLENWTFERAIHGERITFDPRYRRYALLESQLDGETTVEIYDVETGKLLSVFATPESDSIRSLAFDALATTILIDYPSVTYAYDIETGENVTISKRLPIMNDISPDSSYGVVTDFNSLEVYDLVTGELVHNLLAHSSLILDVQFSGTSDRLVSIDTSGTIFDWDLRDGSIVGHLEDFSPIGIDRSNDQLFIKDSTSIRQIDLQTLAFTDKQVTLPFTIYQAYMFDASSRLLVSQQNSDDDSIFYDFYNNRPIQILGYLHIVDPITEEIPHTIELREEDIGTKIKKLLYNRFSQDRESSLESEWRLVMTRINDAYIIADTNTVLVVASTFLVDEDNDSSGPSVDIVYQWNLETNTFRPLMTTIYADYYIMDQKMHSDGLLYVLVAGSGALTTEVIQFDPINEEIVGQFTVGDARFLYIAGDNTLLLHGGDPFTFEELRIHRYDIDTGKLLTTYPTSANCCMEVQYDMVSNRVFSFELPYGGGGFPLSPSLQFGFDLPVPGSFVADLTTDNPLLEYDFAGQLIGFNEDYSRYYVYARDQNPRLIMILRNDTLESLIRWTCENRYVPELTDEQRELYGITRTTPICDELSTS